MRRFYFTVFAILTIVALSSSSSFAYEKELKSISTNMSEKIARAGKKTVAVVDFTDLQGNVTELGRFIAEEFSVALADADKGFEIVDRTHLQTLLKEHKLSTTGIIDPSTAKKLGEIAGVDALVTGTITPFGDSVRISIKILDTSTARVIGASSGEIAKTKAIEELLARGIMESGSPVGESTTTPSAPTTIGKAIEAEGFIFKPIKCSRSGKKTICTISFMNNGNQETQLRVHGGRNPSSYLYDNRGNQYRVIIQIGPRTDDYSISEKFIPQLPVNVHFIAEDVHTEATHMTVAIGIDSFKSSVAVRNIAITK